MKTLIKLGLAQATWAWIGIILFFILGFGRIQNPNGKPEPSHPIEKSRSL